MKLSTFLTLAALLHGAAAFAQQPVGTPPAKGPGGDQSIVVTGSRSHAPPPPKLTPVGYFGKLCFDANRLTRKSLEPKHDPNWNPLRYEFRQKLGIPDSDNAYELTDKTQGYTLVFTTEQIKEPDDELENRCSIIIVGGNIQPSLIADMSALLHAKPWPGRTDGRGGLPHLPDWHHWVWTAMPTPSSKSWRGFAWDDTVYSVMLPVTNPIGFYLDYDFVLVDVKTKIDAETKVAADPQVSVISLAFIRRVDPKSWR
jgi:hypothetical protein